MSGSLRTSNALPSLPLLLDDVDMSNLTWVGLPFDDTAEPAEVLRALIHLALEPHRVCGEPYDNPALTEMIHRLRSRGRPICPDPNAHRVGTD